MESYVQKKKRQRVAVKENNQLMAFLFGSHPKKPTSA